LEGAFEELQRGKWKKGGELTFPSEQSQTTTYHETWRGGTNRDTSLLSGREVRKKMKRSQIRLRKESEENISGGGVASSKRALELR